MADNPRGTEIVRKAGKSGKPVRSLWIFIASLALVFILVEMKPISDFFGRRITVYLGSREEALMRIGMQRTNQLAEQLQKSPLPGKTVVDEEIRYGTDRELRIFLYIDSDLSLKDIQDYYQGLGLKPVVGGDHVSVIVNQADDDSMKSYIEGMAKSRRGSVQTFATGPSYQNSYYVIIMESEVNFAASAAPQ